MHGAPPYVDVPVYALPLHAEDSAPLPFTPPTSSSPHPPSPGTSDPMSPTSPKDSVSSPSRFNISSMLLSQALGSLPTPPPTNGQNVRQGGGQTLMSAKDALSIPIMSANFRRFIGKCGPVFWLQDRVEEVVMWRKGTAYTVSWMAAYAFFCYFPRLALLIPHIILLHVLFTTYQSRYPDGAPDSPAGGTTTQDFAPVTQPPEGTPDWFANLQAIQNLMGIVSDAYDFVSPYLIHLSWSTSTTAPLFAFTLLSLFALMPVLYFVPLRLLFLVLGLTPFAITHPYTLSVLPLLVGLVAPHVKAAVQKAVNDDRLREEHWRNRMATVSVWENQRWAAGSGWSTNNLRPDDRKAWTVGEEGWAITNRGEIGTGQCNVRDLTFPLPSGWKFVGTEDWSIDFCANWHQAMPDQDGWVYMDPSWATPQTVPRDEWKAVGMTRCRKWARRIYFS
ncbi:hypothetical protein M407DRAFT_29751 [Tulasnella calospora MUT 4182]|uniref:TECPR1-like DysF domain-containing protein n=1 Tax=Tulasnella calospora MUT 4182 TaxID=1051891 RepID=A0A0C3Q9J2_9AGAM|nr:hypothetical protein M407DRAFT_29751 [Tulasnella calospora MUT 4182]